MQKSFNAAENKIAKVNWVAFVFITLELKYNNKKKSF